MKILASLLTLLLLSPLTRAGDPLAWPEIKRESRPWAYWWWMASAVDPASITHELERYRDAGLGGVHIIPIYGAKGYEDRYIDYLSPKWMEMLRRTVTEASRLGLGVDMTTGTGWCFGGPQLGAAEANAIPVVEAMSVEAGATIPKKIDPAKIQALVAFSNTGTPVNLKEKIRSDGSVDWTAPEGNSTVYAISQKPSGQKVKRSGPGGNGPMLNLFSPAAVDIFLKPYTAAFAAYDGPRPRAQYHDSYEYKSEWSPELLSAFRTRRGYALENELPAMFGNQEDDRAARVKCDYRETLSDLMIEESLPRWTSWAHERGFITRNEAHGSPGNLLDLYAVADIPETEMFFKDRSPLMAKFASSAAHVNGRTLTSSETGTWLKEHFNETLADMKSLVDELFLSGVNHVFYHGTCFSPDDAAWPGWLFYAATEMNPRNAIWHDVPALNAYIARCQAALQSGRADNDVLLYWPIHDLWHAAKGMTQGLTVHAAHEWLLEKPIGHAATELWTTGYSFDYVSDRQLLKSRAAGGAIETATDIRYRAVVIPKCDHLPIATMEQLLALAENGGTVIFQDHLPADVPGWGDLEKRREQLRALVAKLKPGAVTEGVSTAKLGRGTVMIGDLASALKQAKIERETLIDHPGLLFIRRTVDGYRQYFLNNRSDAAIDGWLPLATSAQAVIAMDPMTSSTGLAATRAAANGSVEVRVQLPPGASLILRALSEKPPAATSFALWQPAGTPIELKGNWRVEFTQGGPALPSATVMSRLDSWTTLGGAAESFAGSARYTLEFDAPAGSAAEWLLDLGKVCQSARIRLNGRDLGTLIQPPYRIQIDGLKPTANQLEVEVTNLSANRIRDLDRRGVAWRTFNDINFVNIDYKPFDASNWPLAESGLLGPVTLTPAQRVDTGR